MGQVLSVPMIGLGGVFVVFGLSEGCLVGFLCVPLIVDYCVCC